jgi:hypothetical protein
MPPVPDQKGVCKVIQIATVVIRPAGTSSFEHRVLRRPRRVRVRSEILIMDGLMNDESFAEAVARIQRTLRNRCGQDAACVTLVAERSVADVRSGFLVEPTSAPCAPHQLPVDVPAVSLLEAPGGIVAVEDDGLAGSDPATLQRLSAGTRAASMYWNGIGDVPIGDDRADPDFAAAFAGLDTSAHGITFCGLLAVERFTGVRIDGEPLEEPAAVFPVRIEGAPERLMPALGAIRAATLIYRGNEDRNALSAAIAALPATAQRRLAAVVASNLFRHVGLHTSPEIAEAVRLLTDPAGPRFSEPIEIAMLQARDAEAGGVIDLKTRAMRVLATAANPDPHLAALEAIWGVRQVLTPDIQVTFDADIQRVLDRAARKDQ